MSSYVLDASAVIALLEDEAGASTVSAALEKSVISSVNLCEVLSWLVREGSSPAVAEQAIDELRLSVVPFDEAQARQAAELMRGGRRVGISLGDRVCLTLGKRLQIPVLTADRAWSRIKTDVDVRQIREQNALRQ